MTCDQRDERELEIGDPSLAAGINDQILILERGQIPEAKRTSRRGRNCAGTKRGVGETKPGWVK